VQILHQQQQALPATAGNYKDAKAPDDAEAPEDVQGYAKSSLNWSNLREGSMLSSPRAQLASPLQNQQGSFLFESKDSISGLNAAATLAPSAAHTSAAHSTIPSSGGALSNVGSAKAGKGGPVCIDCSTAFLCDWGLAPMLVPTVLSSKRGNGSNQASMSRSGFSGDPASQGRLPVGPPAEVFLCSLAAPSQVNKAWLLSNQLEKLPTFARALRAAQRQGRMSTKSGKLAAWRKGLHSILGAAINPQAAAQRNFMVGAGPSLEHVLEVSTLQGGLAASLPHMQVAMVPLPTQPFLANPVLS
jgi:hypothetical protein